jgi:hypothetical protein
MITLPENRLSFTPFLADSCQYTGVLYDEETPVNSEVNSVIRFIANYGHFFRKVTKHVCHDLHFTAPLRLVFLSFLFEGPAIASAMKTH